MCKFTAYLLVVQPIVAAKIPPLVILFLFLGQGQWSVFWSLGRSSSCLAKVERRFRITRAGEESRERAGGDRVAITLDTAMVGKGKPGKGKGQGQGLSTYPCFIALVTVVGLLALDAKLIEKQILLEKVKVKIN